MRLLVFGGTVYLSKAVAALGVSRGHDVTIASRGVTGEPPDGVRFLKVDRTEVGALAPLAGEKFDAVVDVARLPLQVGCALDALAADAGHWCFVSSGSVYADDETPGQVVAGSPLLEPAPGDSSDLDVELYGASKVTCENLVRERLGERSLHLRAGLIIGPHDPGDRFGYWPHRIAEGGEVLAPGCPDDLVQFIDVRDLAAWIVDSAENGVTGTYDGACPPISWLQFLTEIAQAVDASPSFTWVPGDFLTEHGVAPWAGEESLGLWLPARSYAGSLSRDVTASVEAGMKIRPLAETTRAWVAASAESPTLRASLSRDKEAAVLASWHSS